MPSLTNYQNSPLNQKIIFRNTQKTDAVGKIFSKIFLKKVACSKNNEQLPWLQSPVYWLIAILKQLLAIERNLLD